MSCDRTAQIHAFHDGELAPELHPMIEAHLGECPECRELLADLRKLSTLVFAAPQARALPIQMARISNRAWHREQDRGVLRISAWLSGVAAAVLIGSVLYWPSVGGIAGGGGRGAENPSVASAATWQTAALMPPAESGEVPEPVQLAQFMASDLSH
jgi:anti-sigma factor RsiW